jgi:CRISPR-associated protein Cas2
VILLDAQGKLLQLESKPHKVVTILESYGIRAQFSVFECSISTRQQMTLEGKLRRVINEEEDELRFYPLNEADLTRVKTLGIARLHLGSDSLII